MDAAQSLANFIVDLKFEDLPKSVVKRAKHLILDTMGVIIAASSQAPEPEPIVKLVIKEGGRKESTILGYGNKVPCYMAAFANGAMTHALDYDDLYHDARLHVGVSCVPPALAIMERIGNVSGKELLTAVVAGAEIQSRLGLSVVAGDVECREKWFLAPVLGVFSAAASVSKLLKLNKEQTLNALGIAYNQSSGSREMATGMLRAIYGAIPGKAGVLAALMAEQGITATPTSLEGKAGLFPVYFDNKYDRGILLNGLGREFRYLGGGFKPWPACGYTHFYIDPALQIAEEQNIAPEDVDVVTAYTEPFVQRLLCEPLAQKRKPEQSIQGKYSIPFTIAHAIVRRKVNMGSFTSAGLNDAAVLKLAQRVVPQVDPDFGRVAVRLKNGKTFTKKTEFPLGFAQRPLQDSHIEAKFRDCLAYALKPLPKGAATRMIKLVQDLENLDDATRIIKAVTPQTGRKAK